MHLTGSVFNSSLKAFGSSLLISLRALTLLLRIRTGRSMLKRRWSLDCKLPGFPPKMAHGC